MLRNLCCPPTTKLLFIFSSKKKQLSRNLSNAQKQTYSLIGGIGFGRTEFQQFSLPKTPTKQNKKSRNYFHIHRENAQKVSKLRFLSNSKPFSLFIAWVKQQRPSLIKEKKNTRKRSRTVLRIHIFIRPSVAELNPNACLLCFIFIVIRVREA